MNEPFKSPLEMFYRWENETPNKVYLRQPRNLEWTDYTWSQVSDQVRRIAAYLKNKHYPAGSRIAIWSSNSKDWPICDFAIMLAGHISVPIYPGQDTSSANYIFKHANVKLVFCGAFDQSAFVEEALIEGMETVAMLGCKIETYTSLEKILEQNEPFLESPIPAPEDVFTIMYTSGTTGNPKGVMHMHQTPGHVVPGVIKAFGFQHEKNKLFSFLPMSHAGERILVELLSLYVNAPVSFSEGIDTFTQEIRSVQPTFFFAVPRLWIKFKEAIDTEIRPELQATLSAQQKKAIAQLMGLSEARVILTGSSPCPPKVQEWFINMGIILRDAYGMTETFIQGCGWLHNDEPISGCVGKPTDDSVKMRLSDEGEIQLNCKGLMKGYYRDPEKTAEVLDEGWYCTGDSGKFDKDGNLWVTGRMSEVFKTSKGKFIEPSRLEKQFGCNRILAQYCVVGHGYDQPILLATLSNLGQVLEKDNTLKAEIENIVEALNSKLPSYEKVKQVFITPEWTIENGFLTPTMKLKRKQIEKTYKYAIEANTSDELVNFLKVDKAARY